MATARELGLNPRALGTNPRALGTNPKALGETAKIQAAKLEKARYCLKSLQEEKLTPRLHDRIDRVLRETA